MPNDPFPVEPGSTGTVVSVTGGAMAQIDVNWDNGRSLCLLPGVDEYEITAKWHETLRHATGCPKCGNRQFDGVGTNLQGQVISCDACGWKRGGEDADDSGSK